MTLTYINPVKPDGRPGGAHGGLLGTATTVWLNAPLLASVYALVNVYKYLAVSRITGMVRCSFCMFNFARLW